MRRVWVVISGLLIVVAACTGSASSTTAPTVLATTSSTSTTSTTLPPFNPATWVLENLVEIRSEGMPFNDTHQLASGFGILVSDGGLVLTTASAVLGASRVNVFLPDEEFPVEASIESVAECRDLALINIGRTRPGLISLNGDHGPAAWSVSIADGDPVVDALGTSTASPRLSIDADGNVVSIDGVAGSIPASNASDVVEEMRRRDLVSELGFLVAPVSNGLEILAVGQTAIQLSVGDIITGMAEGENPTLDDLCDRTASGPVEMLLLRNGRDWEGELGGREFQLTTARTPDEIKNATVRVDVDRNSDGLFDGSGSGFFITETGLLVTNHHVVAGAPTVGALEVVFDNFGDRLSASIIGRSSCSDIAVLQVERSGTAYLEFSPDPPRLDDSVRSVGYPDGTDLLTIKQGNVSKEIAAKFVNSPTISTFEHSAEVIGGSSGGPVVNETGEVVGIVWATRSISGIIEELAISGLEAMLVVEQLERGDFDHVGMEWTRYSDGIFLDSVDPESMAAAAGLRVEDKLVLVGNQDLSDDSLPVKDLCELVLIGDEVPLLVERSDGDETFRMDGFLNGRALERIPEPLNVSDPSDVIGTLIPGRWTDYQGFESTAESDFRGFRAGPDIDRFLNGGFGAHPGIRVAVSLQAGLNRTPFDRLEANTYSQCTDNGVSAVDEREYQGFVRRWTDCQGTDSVLLDYALTDTLQSPVMVVITIIASPGDVDETSELVLRNLEVSEFPSSDDGEDEEGG